MFKLITDQSILAASLYVANIDTDWLRLVNAVGPCTHTSKPEREPYEALVRAVAYQQLHARAAEAILGRLLALHQGAFPKPLELVKIAEQQLRICGFSGRKIITLKALAQGAIDGLVPNRRCADRMPDAELLERLVSLPGIGRWTVEMLMIYTLERLDIFPLDDLGVREGYRALKSLTDLPDRKTLQQAEQACRPYGTIAAWYLWRAAKLPDYQKRK